MNWKNHKSVKLDFNVGRISSLLSFICSTHAVFKFSIAIFYVHIIPNALHVVIPFHRFDIENGRKGRKNNNERKQ